MILIQGSVPGSKNGIVLLRDAIKFKTPAEAPFPAGLHIENNKNKENVSLSNAKEETSSNIEGAEVEN